MTGDDAVDGSDADDPDDSGPDWSHLDLDVRRLRRGDLAAARRLSAQAGWNQLEVDWERLLALAPERCFAGWTGGDLVATATAVGYDDRVAWIGMVLVEETERSQGYGTTLFRRAVAAALEEDLAVGLDATDRGASVYRTEGFVETRPITRWAGTPTAASPAAVEPFDDAGVASDYDRSACGVDRERLLSGLLAESRSVGLACRGGDGDRSLDGYAILRPGREQSHLGPVIADGHDAARALLAAAGEHTGDAGVLVDALGAGATDPDAGGRGALLAEGGLSPQRHLVRMTRDGDPLLSGERVVAGAGFELG